MSVSQLLATSVADLEAETIAVVDVAAQEHDLEAVRICPCPC